MPESHVWKKTSKWGEEQYGGDTPGILHLQFPGPIRLNAVYNHLPVWVWLPNLFLQSAARLNEISISDRPVTETLPGLEAGKVDRALVVVS